MLGTAPFTCQTPEKEIAAYCASAKRQGAVFAEVGVWKNLFDPDPAIAAGNLSYAKGQLALRTNGISPAASTS